MRAVYAHGDQWRHDDGPVALPLSADVLFNFQRYHGGALVLYALRQKIGDREVRAPRTRVGVPLPRRRGLDRRLHRAGVEGVRRATCGASCGRGSTALRRRRCRATGTGRWTRCSRRLRR